MPVLYLVDLYFGTDFAGKLLYGEVKKFCDTYLAFGTALILDDFRENGHATLKISEEYHGIGFLTPCDVVWDFDTLDLSSKNKAEAIKEVKSYRPTVVFKGRIQYNDDPIYTCNCST
jgi:hypothetical protein